MEREKRGRVLVDYHCHTSYYHQLYLNTQTRQLKHDCEPFSAVDTFSSGLSMNCKISIVNIALVMTTDW